MSATDSWYLAQNGEQKGPVSEEALLEDYQSGKLEGDTLVWTEGMEKWRPISEVFEKIHKESRSFQTPPAVPINPSVSLSNLSVSNSSATSENTAVVNPDLVRQGWRRFIARVIDGVFMSVLWGFLALVFYGPDVLLEYAEKLMAGDRIFTVTLAVMTFVLNGVLEAFLISKWGMTIGKWILRIRVVHKEERFLTFGEAFKRYLMVLFRGQAFNLLPLNFIFGALSLMELANTGSTNWDKSTSSDVQHGTMRFVHHAVAFVVSLVVIAVLFRGS